jgi:hypothetical protein
MEGDFKETEYEGVDWIYVAQGCECGSETSDPIKYVEFLEKVGDYWKIKENNTKIFPYRKSLL